MEYDNWVNNEYEIWRTAICEMLNDENAIIEFKKCPALDRMLGGSIYLYQPFLDKLNLKLDKLPLKEIELIDQIGCPPNTLLVSDHKISGMCLRYIYYADKVLNIIQDMKNINILEIGGGYGGFCSILHVMAEDRKIKIDEYSSFDLLEAQKLQKYYLGKTIHKSDYGIQKTTFKDQKDIENFENTYNYCVSFYALGEFPKEIQNKYIKCVVSKISHGFIIWNPPHDIINDDGKILLKTYHPNIQEDIEDPLTGTKNLELKF